MKKTIFFLFSLLFFNALSVVAQNKTQTKAELEASIADDAVDEPKMWQMGISVHRVWVLNQNILRDGGSESRISVWSSLDPWGITSAAAGFQLHQPHGNEDNWRDENLNYYQVTTSMRLNLINLFLTGMNREKNTKRAGLSRIINLDGHTDTRGLYADASFIVEYLHALGDPISEKTVKEERYRYVTKITALQKREVRYGGNLSLGIGGIKKISWAFYGHVSMMASAAIGEGQRNEHFETSKESGKVKSFNSAADKFVGVMGLKMHIGFNVQKSYNSKYPYRLFCPRF
jgi:hypothetical protein